MSYNMWLLTVLVITLSLIGSSIVVLVLGVKVGSYLEARRKITREQQAVQAEQNAYVADLLMKAKTRQQKLEQALMSEEDDELFAHWEEFYAELGRHK